MSATGPAAFASMVVTPVSSPKKSAMSQTRQGCPQPSATISRRAPLHWFRSRSTRMMTAVAYRMARSSIQGNPRSHHPRMIPPMEMGRSRRRSFRLQLRRKYAAPMASPVTRSGRSAPVAVRAGRTLASMGTAREPRPGMPLLAMPTTKPQRMARSQPDGLREYMYGDEKRVWGKGAGRALRRPFFRRRRPGKPAAAPKCAAEWRCSRQRVTLGCLRGTAAGRRRRAMKSWICGANPQYICHELSSFPA